MNTSAPGKRRMQIITLGSKKGGVGKTTLSFNLATATAGAGYRTLLVDVDSQSPTTRTFDAKPGEKNLATLLRTPLGAPMNTADAVIKDIRSNLDILNAGHDDLELASQFLETQGALGSKILRRVLADVQDDYDYVIIDTPPELGGLEAAAVIAADWAIAVSRASTLDLVPTLQFVSQVTNLNLAGESNAKMLGVVWNFFDGDGAETQFQLEQLAMAYPDIPVFETTVRSYKDLSKANALKTTAVDGFKNYPAGQNMLEFAIEVITHLSQGTTPRAAGELNAPNPITEGV